MIEFLKMFVAVPIHVMVRFGKWHDILCEPLPPGADVLDMDDELGIGTRFAGTIAVQRYARGLALAALGRVEEAEKEYAL